MQPMRGPAALGTGQGWNVKMFELWAGEEGMGEGEGQEAGEGVNLTLCFTLPPHVPHLHTSKQATSKK